MLLGRVTHAANHHEVVVTTEDGRQMKQVLRDAAQAESSRGRTATAGIGSQQQKATVPAAPTPAPPLEPRLHGLSPSAIPPPLVPMGKAAKQRGASEAAYLQRRLSEIGASLTAPAGRPSATERLEALRHRVRSRSAT